MSHRNLNYKHFILFSAKKRTGVLKTDVHQDVLPILAQLKAELSEASVGYREELVGIQDEIDDIDMKSSVLTGR